MAEPVTGIDATLTLHVKQDAAGLLVSLAPEGDFDGGTLARRFYSIAGLPPPDLAPEAFWGTLLHDISGFLLADDEPG
jgi:hypothetical protein